MLTVWCVCWGDKYTDYYVQRLQREVNKYLTLDHRFVCVTTRDIEGVECIPPINNLPGWWGKTNLFSFDVCSDQNLYLDLDVVITGNLDEMLMRYGNASLAMPLNWAQSGFGGCQSSVMIWKKNYNAKQIYDLFDPAIAHWPPINQPGVVLWGDQEWISELRDSDKVAVTPITEGIKSYKYHCRNGLPEGTSIVVFHGDPKPEFTSESWFQW